MSSRGFGRALLSCTRTPTTSSTWEPLRCVRRSEPLESMEKSIPGASFAVLDSITHANEAHRGYVVIAGSHGGDYCGWYAVQTGLRAVILHDAGVGLKQAGIGCLQRLGQAGMPRSEENTSELQSLMPI